jgi:hypothetical protein
MSSFFLARAWSAFLGVGQGSDDRLHSFVPRILIFSPWALPNVTRF